MDEGRPVAGSDRECCTEPSLQTKEGSAGVFFLCSLNCLFCVGVKEEEEEAEKV